jgi:hypothetical protein
MQKSLVDNFCHELCFIKSSSGSKSLWKLFSSSSPPVLLFMTKMVSVVVSGQREQTKTQLDGNICACKKGM